jgi:integrase
MKTLSTVLEVAAAKARGLHPISNAPGLFLQISKGAARSWVFRYRIDGARRIMGLGSLRGVSLADARKAATAAAGLRDKGVDPIAEKREKRQARIEARRLKAAPEEHPFRVVAEDFIILREAVWKRPTDAKLWRAAFERWIFPTLGDIGVAAITLDDVVAALKGAWTATPEQARRLRGRIEAIIDHATALGYRDIRLSNPAAARLLRHRLAPRKRQIVHFRAVALDEAPNIFQRIAAVPTTALRAHTLMILCATRPSEALLAEWSEFDLGKKLWTIPASRMKGGREHVIPLAPMAIGLLAEQAKVRASDFVFPGSKPDAPLSYNHFATAPAKRGIDAGTPHSWRSIFRDACGDLLGAPRDLAESQLAHTLPAVEGSYRRLTAVERRRALLLRYSQWLKGEASASILPFAVPGAAAAD